MTSSQIPTLSLDAPIPLPSTHTPFRSVNLPTQTGPKGSHRIPKGKGAIAFDDVYTAAWLGSLDGPRSDGALPCPPICHPGEVVRVAQYYEIKI